VRLVALLVLALAAAPAQAQHKPWFAGTRGTGAVQWTPPGIQRATGPTWPVVGGATGTTGSATTTSFSTNETPTICVAAVGFGNFDGNTQTPITVAWSGGSGCSSSWTKQPEANISGHHTASIWTTTCSSAVSSRAVQASGTSSTNTTISVAVECLLQASTTVGTNQTSTTAMNVTLTGIASGSWIYVASMAEETTTISEVSGTTRLRSDNIAGNVISATGANTAGASGSVQVGWSTTQSFRATAALEIKTQ